MRFLLVLAVFILFGLSAIAQDTIKKKDSDSIRIMNESFQLKGLKDLEQFSLFVGKDESKGFIYSDQSESDLSDRIHGPSQFDSRIELIQLVPPNEPWKEQIIYNASSVGIVVERSMVEQIDDSLWQLDASTSLGQRFNLCSYEAFNKQPVVGFGTAFLIDNGRMITAGHVFDTPFRDLVVIFGFEIIDTNSIYKRTFESSDIYEIVSIENRSPELDAAIFKLDRPANRNGLRISQKKQLETDRAVYMIGHPSGLPKKVALNAEVTKNSNSLFFYTSLDAFQGNSGSPVFDFETHEVIGVLVSGNVDYQWNGNCRETTLFHLDQTDGEKVIRIEAILEELRE